MREITPLELLGNSILSIENPARYVGGEYGSIIKDTSILNFAIAFPDLYEIGMSNQALKIIYNLSNEIPEVSCERVFAPAPDFENLLEEKKIPLFSLETSKPIKEFDILGFTFGYELGISGALSILKSSQIPLTCDERSENTTPITIAGGPAITNPEPFLKFIDYFWIGEAENQFFELLRDIKELKKSGKTKQVIRNTIEKHPNIYYKNKKQAVRNIHTGFSSNNMLASVLPISSIKIVQDHGYVEIMRGCPNGCRFCHAGVWYRPMRQKDPKLIKNEVKQFIEKGGYNEISLSSLSSGDYKGLPSLLDDLVKKWSDKSISFQLPSLKVSSFSLSLLELLSDVRKGGLTFAIETPNDMWQLTINKEVAISDVLAIMKEAWNRGWRKAKFYFMIGLPINTELSNTTEEDAIISFIREIKYNSKMNINVNIGTFVPKPHTPFQWCKQLDEEEARKKLLYIKNKLYIEHIKVHTHDPFISTLEGLISRGNRDVSDVILKVFLKGSRFDAWEDYIKRDIWREVLGTNENKNLIENTLAEKDIQSELPWKSIESGVGIAYLKKEYLKSKSNNLTNPCSNNCINPCGICNEQNTIVENNIHANKPLEYKKIERNPFFTNSRGTTYRIVFSWSKTGKAIYVPHLGVINIFSKAFTRSDFPVKYTQGFNPLPRIDFAAPMSTGFTVLNDIATIDTIEPFDAHLYAESINPFLPEGFHINEAYSFSINEGDKKYSAASLYQSSFYIAYTDNTKNSKIENTLILKEEKPFRNSFLEANPEAIIIRSYMNAVHPLERDKIGSYFELYKLLYEEK